jgi:hypothetical protein
VVLGTSKVTVPGLKYVRARVKEMNESKIPENRAYKVTLILLLGLAAFSTAMRELNRLHEMVSSVHEFTSQWRGTDVVTPSEKSISSPETISDKQSCPKDNPHLINSSVESGLGDLVAAATNGDVDTMDYKPITEARIGAKVDLIAGRRANRNVPLLARAKNAPARNPKQEISAIRRDGNWPARFEYKTVDGRVTLELPMTMVTHIKADAFETEPTPDVVLRWLGKLDRKQSHGKNETRRRELMIKRFERNTSSRRAS